jgi:1-deoxy-D-xylulose-5-phosphate reductoisomerase
MKKRICILGATGSIGKNTLDVVRSQPDAFEVVGLSAHRDLETLLDIGGDFPRSELALTGTSNTVEGVRFTGPGAAADLAGAVGADIVVNGIAGAAGLLPSYAAIQAGSNLALANKETVVMAWPVITAEAERRSIRILPVDSEHSAVFHLIDAHGKENLEEIVLTASGGPFRSWSRERLAGVTVADALAHPTWNMGGKITIDSASLANKGLEVIEAVRLFGVSPNRVSVVVHPQSKIHSLIRTLDGSLYAQISQPDMRVPIHNALFWPDCQPTPFGRLDLVGANLTFEAPNGDLFPMLPLAYRAAERGGLYPTAYNAADEVAVDAFINRGLSFMDIPNIVAEVLASDWYGHDDSIESILDGDRQARILAQKTVSALMEAHS